ncbi:MAG: ATP-binding protein [Nanoarchaeota archaeon]|nr:ATP-binding protein [Nanoarchaeota archaeon]
MNLEKHNLHWKDNFFYKYSLSRAIFSELKKNLDNRQVITISGLRRTGKTVLMKQLIDFLIGEGKNRENILYFSFDEEQPKIEEIIKEFEKIANINISKTKIYIFLDEIQKLDDWQDQIKYYYDNFNIKFFVSGSSSLFIRRQVKESLAGRSFDFHLSPLNFKEFLIFKNKEQLLKNLKMFKDEIKKEFDLYSKKQFIEVIDKDEEYTSEYVKSILEKIVFIDIPKVFPIDYQDLLIRLLKIIASNPGMIIEYENLSKELGINRITLSNYLFYLEEAFLIKKIYNFSKNMLTSEKKSKKFYLNSTSFFSYLNSGVEESKLIENLVAIETDSKFFWRTPFKDEVDFILVESGSDIKQNVEANILPIEVKYKNNIADKDMKTIIKFCVKNNLSKALLLSKDIEENKIISKDSKKITIKIIPVWKWLLEYKKG